MKPDSDLLRQLRDRDAMLRLVSTEAGCAKLQEMLETRRKWVADTEALIKDAHRNIATWKEEARLARKYLAGGRFLA